MTIVALIVAAGSGTRAGGAVPKQFAPVAGRPMLAWSHAALAAHPAIDDVMVAIPAGEEDRTRAILGINEHLSRKKISYPFFVYNTR